MSHSLVDDLKRKLSLLCSNSILNPPLPFVGALRYSSDDTDEEKEKKRLEHEEKCQQREKERIRREPELMQEMDSIIKRVFASHAEPLPEDAGEYSFGVQARTPYRETATKFGNVVYFCESCGNKVSD